MKLLIAWCIILAELFSKLVPLAVHAAMSAFEAKKGQLVNMEVGRIREATQTLNGYVICIFIIILGNFIF